MYYNIKIKSEGSEFSLNSSNKEITQREMDIYFACIFNASNEFKSRIKKIEINNDSVKSINELEIINNKNNAASIEDSPVQNHDKTPQIIAIESQEQTEATQNENIVSNKSLQIETRKQFPKMKFLFRQYHHRLLKTILSRIIQKNYKIKTLIAKSK